MYEDPSGKSGATNERTFCGKCGSMVMHQRPAKPEYIAIPSGVIHGDRADLKPAAEYDCIRRPAWLDAVGSAAQFDRLPTA